MILARDKNGRLGRKIRSMGEHAVVEVAPMAEPTRNVIVSNDSINQDQRMMENEVANYRQKQELQKKRWQAMHEAEAIAHLRRTKEIEEEQKNLPKDMTNEVLRAYFTQYGQLSETQRVNRSVKADFFDREITNDPDFVSHFSPRADFKQNALVGSPLTRDGSFGPSTDWDRLVFANKFDSGHINEPAMLPDIVGGTMLGRYNGKDTHFGRRMMDRLPAKGMGYWGEGLVDAFTSGLSTAGESAAKQAADRLVQDQLRQAFPPPAAPPTYTVLPAPPQASYVPQVITQPIQSAAGALGVPPWTIYAAAGLVGVGLLVVLLKNRG